ncbi:bifunctional ADP-dependent NAD(P)H-hydrate dehydratase/NAD(P)H-hydrate epimerase [Thermocladium modestius]|uniref:Bifunctional NAD(P)H-hydrate repair enzyme n=1 Tax=Thermocladium modestius TaxID=62609 RepID=A0A830GVB2_9CREN|nr:NAD(P)H-hydrate dehydratase [Thermocladium modestius]GGP20392.1 bifunctional ADP-dependent NAD(P)H-hydrate dehydratase/NAD(P)H-hydrate epimerase [Thermocladium modestius]
MDGISTLEMRILDKNAEYLGISDRILMENAGKAVADATLSRYPTANNITVVAGLGNNGGDGIVAARYLLNSGRNVIIILLGRVSDVSEEPAATNVRLCNNLLRCKIVEARDEYSLLMNQDLILRWPHVIIDAVLGIGVKGRLRQPHATAIDLMNMSPAPKIAVDVPSGLDSDSGKVWDKAVKAAVTVTMHKAKRGLLLDDAKSFVGELIVADIGIPKDAELLVGAGDMLVLNYGRDANSKKGDNGKIMVIGGSKYYTGAVMFTALSALTMGADLVNVYTPRDVAHDIRSNNPSIIAIPMEGDSLDNSHVESLTNEMEKFHVIAIGPGLGLSAETQTAVLRLLENAMRLGKKVVIDADAIKAVGNAGRLDLLKGAVVTPHAGEFKSLFGIEVPTDPLERGEVAKRIVAEKAPGTIVLLKGNTDIITDGSRLRLNKTGNPGMSIGGTGDVLTGVTAYLAFKVGDLMEAASLAAFITGLAGDLAVIDKGFHITPLDVVERLPKVLSMFYDIRRIAVNSLHPQVHGFLDAAGSL